MFDFRPVSDEHLPVLADWLTQPHVSKWWGEPNRELELIRTGRSSGEADGYVVYLAGQPMGYVQSWVPANFDEEEWMQQQPEGTIGVDIFVGEPAVTGKGLGPAIIRQFCAKLIDDGAKRIIIDPDPANERAVSAYRKAGFRPLAEYPSPSGATLLMEFNREVCRGQA